MPCATEVVSLQEKDGGIEIHVRLDRDAPAAEELTVVTPLKDFERRVRVFGSDNGKDWTPLVTDGLVFDYSRYMNVSNHDIRLPKNRWRQFRVIVDNITDVRQSPFMELTRKTREGNRRAANRTNDARTAADADRPVEVLGFRVAKNARSG